MSHPNLTPIKINSLNARQRENYNFAKVSAILADYGFVTMRLTDDWQGADFIANHISGSQFLKVQLKSRLCVDTKYKGKDVWICFPHQGQWYLFPHDAFLEWCLANSTIGRTKGWSNVDDFAKIKGVYSWRSPGKKVLEDFLSKYAVAERVD